MRRGEYKTTEELCKK